MLSDGLAIHRTVSNRFSIREGGGWEFTCKECGYHARYWVQAQPGLQNLEILDIGDPAARHTSGNFSPHSVEEWETGDLIDRGDLIDHKEDACESQEMESEEENWLTPELRMQLADILKAFDDDEPRRA